MYYKGQYVEECHEDEPFICAITGAHFDFENMCRLLLRVKARRKSLQMTITSLLSPSKISFP